MVRTDDGRWLAGRRAGWVSTWAGRWALGAGGAVDLGESPAETLPRELREEWQLEAHSLSIEALVRLPNGLAMVVGLATVADASEPVPDDEHDEWAWWDPDPDRWPGARGRPRADDGPIAGGGALGARRRPRRPGRRRPCRRCPQYPFGFFARYCWW